MNRFRKFAVPGLAALMLGLLLVTGFIYASPTDYYGVGGLTENAGTRIQVGIPGMPNAQTYLSLIAYKDAGTAHTITVMRKVSETTTTAATSASGTVINITADPGTGTGPGAIAASDVVAIKLTDGSWHFSAVSSVTSLAVTLSTALPSTAGCASGARFLFYGAPSDTVHNSWKFTGGSGSSTTYFPSNNGGLPYGCLARSKGADEPLVVDSNNASNAGTFVILQAFYAKPSN